MRKSIKIMSIILAVVMVVGILPIAQMGPFSSAVTQYNLMFPLPKNSGYRVTSNLGGRTAPCPGASVNHKGIDLAVAGGTQVYAIEAGKVIDEGYNSSRGNFIAILHESIDLISVYQHLKDRALKKKGTTVSQGTVLGYVGTTGSSTGNHLHYELIVASSTSNKNVNAAWDSKCTLINGSEANPNIKYKYHTGSDILEEYFFDFHASFKVMCSSKSVRAESNGSSSTTRTVKQGDTVTVVGYTYNQYGNLWYKTDRGDYIHPTYLQAQPEDCDSLPPTDYKTAVLEVKAVSKTLRQDPYASADAVGTVSLGDYIHVIGYVYNQYGNLWYETEDGDYIYCSYLFVVSSDSRMPSNYIETDMRVKASSKRLFTDPYASSDSEQGVVKDAIVAVKGYLYNRYGNLWYMTDTDQYIYSNYLEQVTPKSEIPSNYAYHPFLTTAEKAYNTEPYAASQESISIESGKTVNTIGYLINLYGNKWYECEDGCFIYDSSLSCIHSWNNGTITIKASCTETGIKTYTCSLCNAKKTESIPATAHNFGAWMKLNDTQHQRVCSNNSSHIEKANHKWNSGSITTDATCTATGVKSFTCTTCNATKTETISATGHNYGSWMKLNDTQHQRVCAYDASHKQTASHNWNEGKLTVAASCVTDGEITYTCTVCGATKTETVAAYGHSFGGWTRLNDTQHQRVCYNDATHKQTENHLWSGGEITVPATYTADGVLTYYCLVCGAARTEPIPMLEPETITFSNVMLSWTSRTYNAAAQQPTVSVKNGVGNILAENTDYTVSYSTGCKAPGNYTVTVTGMGNYTGTVTKTYTITKQPLDAANVTLSWTSKAYNGSVQKPTVTVKSTHGTTISEGGSYTLTWSGDCKAAGTYTVTITGAGKFTGTVKKTFTITAAKPIASSDVTLSWTGKTYNGSVQKPSVTVKGSTGNIITEGKSYTVTYSADSKAPGSYTVTVKGMGNYSGTVKKTYTITKQPLVASNITLSWTSKAYNGSVQKPTVTVKSTHGTTISEGGSYTLTWSGDCKAAGTYTVTITGAGKFTGTVKKTFTITAASSTKHTIADSDVTLSWSTKVYNNTVQKPTVTVKGATGNVITEGKSYTVSYSAENKNAGTYTVTVTGMGNYTGTVKKTYTITKQELDASRVTLSKISFTYNGKVQQPTVTVKSAAGNTLTLNGSYIVTYSSGCKDRGTYVVVIVGQGNYTGTVTKTFTIK